MRNIDPITAESSILQLHFPSTPGSYSVAELLTVWQNNSFESFHYDITRDDENVKVKSRICSRLVSQTQALFSVPEILCINIFWFNSNANNAQKLKKREVDRDTPNFGYW